MRSVWVKLVLGAVVIAGSFSATLWALRYFGPESAPERRDAQRRHDLATIKNALDAYYHAKGTYAVTGSGAGGEGTGFLNQSYGSKLPSVVGMLHKLGYLDKASIDDPTPSRRPDYMIYLCDGGKRFSVSATLELPKPQEVARAKTTCNALGANGTVSNYKKNFALGN